MRSYLALGQTFAQTPPKFLSLISRPRHPNFPKISHEIYLRWTCASHSESTKFRDISPTSCNPLIADDLTRSALDSGEKHRCVRAGGMWATHRHSGSSRTTRETMGGWGIVPKTSETRIPTMEFEMRNLLKLRGRARKLARHPNFYESFPKV